MIFTALERGAEALFPWGASGSHNSGLQFAQENGNRSVCMISLSTLVANKPQLSHASAQ
jgi:hypothetical protein